MGQEKKAESRQEVIKRRIEMLHERAILRVGSLVLLLLLRLLRRVI